MQPIRMQNLLHEMKNHSLTHLLVSEPSSIFYLTGKWFHPGERLLAILLNVEGHHKILINELFPAEEDLGIEKLWYRDTDQPIQTLADLISDNSVIGIDKNWSAGFLLALMKEKPNCNYVNGSPLLDGLRMKKDQKEVKLMKEASFKNDAALEQILPFFSPERTEKNMIQELFKLYEALGTDGPSFSPIIAFGPNGADPHHEPDQSILQEGDSIIIDIGCVKSSYCSDMTRTVFYKTASPKAREVYAIVKEANERAIATIKPGVSFSDIDKAARSLIEEKGYGEFFTHRTGHSIGIDVHEHGDVSGTNTDKVAPGMIFSIEPGIYLPGEFGVRIEDLVLVTDEGCEVLNQFTKDLIILE